MGNGPNKLDFYALFFVLTAGKQKCVDGPLLNSENLCFFWFRNSML